MRNDFNSNYLAHFGLKKGAKRDDHKYYARVDLPNGLYRYFYDAKEYLAYMQGKAKDVYAHKEEILQDKINQGVNKLEALYNKLDKENKYMTDDWNYDRKIQEVAKTKEWQDIVKRKDPEYVYKDKEGKTVYDIDSYLTKKKHPGLDVADDVVMGRKVTVNKFEKEAAVAGVADYAKTYVALAALGTKFMLEKFKFSQGSYKEEKQAAIDYAVQNKDKIVKAAEMADAASTDPRVIQAISDGEKYIKQYAGNVQNVNVDTISQQTGLSKEDVEQLKKDYETVKRELEKVSNQQNQEKVKAAATSVAKDVGVAAAKASAAKKEKEQDDEEPVSAEERKAPEKYVTKKPVNRTESTKEPEAATKISENAEEEKKEEKEEPKPTVTKKSSNAESLEKKEKRLNQPKQTAKTTKTTKSETKKKTSSEEPKYVEKIKLSNGKYRYFYTQEEYDAYLKEKQQSDAVRRSKHTGSKGHF